jgi:hypothetical protein
MWDLVGAAQRHPRATALYVSFFLGSVAFWKLLQFRTAALDWILTLSASLQSLAFALLVVEAGGGCGEGLSEKALWAFFISHVTRLSTTLWGPGYTPEDNSSDVYLYQMLELCGVLLLGFYLLKLGSMRSMRDVGQGYEKWSVLGGMIGVSMVFAYMTKSTGHNDWFADFSWMFSVWLEALALGPQVLLLFGTMAQVDDGAMHFVALSLGSSLAFAYFWSRNAWDQYSDFQKEGAHYFYWSVLACGFLRTSLCVSFLYLFMRSSKGGKGQYRGVDDVFADDMI